MTGLNPARQAGPGHRREGSYHQFNDDTKEAFFILLHTSIIIVVSPQK